MYIEVPYYQEGDIQGWKQNFGGDRVDSVVVCVGGVRVNYPEGVKVGPEEGFLGGDIEGEDVIHPFEAWEHRKRSKTRHMNIGRHARVPDRGGKGLKAIERGKVSLVNRRIFKED